MADDLNLSKNGTSCHEDYCVESTIYRKVLGTIIFVVVWPFIVLDIKQFPLGRPAAALVGASLMVFFVVAPQEQVYVVLGEKGNLQTLFLLTGMMMLSYYYDREGMLQYITLWIFGKNKPFKHVLWKVCVLSAFLSAIITNDATCVVLTPLLLSEHIKQGRPKREYPPLLLGIATSSNIGSASTFFGNPQNAFIAANSKGQVSLLIFLVTNLPAAIMGLLISVSLLYLCYFRTVWHKRSSLTLSEVVDMNMGVPVPDGVSGETEVLTQSKGAVHKSLAASREELALSYDRSANPLATSLISQERAKLHTTELKNSPTLPPCKNGRVNGSGGGGGGGKSLTRKERSQSSESRTSYGGSSSLQEYGATQQHNHIRNHVQSGRESRLYTRSSESQPYTSSESHDRFGSSMKVSSSDPLLKEKGKELMGGAGSPEPPPTTTTTTTTTGPSGTETQQQQTMSRPRPNWRQRVFVGWLILVTAVLVILLAIPPPPVVPVEFNLGLVPMAAGVLSMFMDTILNKKYAHDVILKVDWTMILMFMGLFIWLSGFQNTFFPSDAFQFIRGYMDLNSVQGVLVFTLFVIIGSNILSNVPLVILIMDQLFNFRCGVDHYCSGQLTGTLLAWISTIAGNFTLIGSVANLIVAEKGRTIADYRLSFWEYLKFGVCSTTLVLFAGLPIVYFASDNVRI